MLRRFAVVPLMLAMNSAVMAGGPIVSTGNVISPLGDLTIRDAPPGGFFQGKGSPIGIADQNSRFTVIETRDINTIGGTETWLKLQLQGNPSAQSGWVFSGPGSNPSANIRILE